jgi:hypothetical protein
MPEYPGPSVDDLVRQKMADPNFYQGATGYLGPEVYQAAADDDALTFHHRFRYECRKWAQSEAEDEYDRARQKWIENGCIRRAA